METPCYLSAATSPRSVCSVEDNSLIFYSAPTSPTSEASNTLFELYKPEPHSNRFNHPLGETSFAFATCRHLDIALDDQSSDSLPMMSFADELFCDGKVVPSTPPPPKLILPLPPGFGVAMEPRSPKSALGQCLWNDDFDPFMVALENVKEERKIGGQKLEEKNNNGPSEYYLGLLSPRVVRQVESKTDNRGSKWCYVRKYNKRQRILRRLFSGSSSRGKESCGGGDYEENNKLKRESGALWKPTFLRRLSLRSNGQNQRVRDNKRVVSRVAKVTLIQYRPRLSLCMGFRGKVSS